MTLPDRIEAEGPSRELDAEIAFDLFAKPVGQKGDGGPSGYLWPEDNPSWSFGLRFPGRDRDWFFRDRKPDDDECLLIWRDDAWVKMNALRVPHFTASLDAALSLVPEGMRWCVDTCDGRPRCFVEPPHPYPGQPWWGNASTPALALCAAALRARAGGA